MVGEMVHGTDRVGLWVVVAREPLVLRVVTNVNDPPPPSVAAWVRHAKTAFRRSEGRKALLSVDPLEQMRQMAASLNEAPS
jgi:hypothetical protein